jgi:hypothetical protein
MSKIEIFLKSLHDLMTVPSLTDWIQAFCSVILVYAAFKALSTWKPQKKFELITELLAKSHIGIEFVRLLRLNRYIEKNEELLKDFHNELREMTRNDFASKNQYRREKFMEAKADQLRAMLTTIIEMKIKAEASFGQNNDFYRFFDAVVGLHEEVVNVHQIVYWLDEELKDDDLSKEERIKKTTERDEYLKTIYVSPDPSKDEILNRFLSMKKALEVHRPKM